MSESKITGVIDAISDYQNKDYFNIALGDAENDDNWYIGDNSLRDYGQFDKGDKVRITVDDNKGSITNVEPVGKPNDVKESGASEDGASREGDSDNNQSYRRSTGSDIFIPPELQVAFKEACKDFREADTDFNMEEEKEFKQSKTAMHYAILKQIGGDQ